MHKKNLLTKRKYTSSEEQRNKNRHRQRYTNKINCNNEMTSQPKALPNIKEYGPNAIEVKDLTFGYSSTGALDSTDERNVLHNLNLNLKTGSRCLLIGANGSGKSTLLRILAGRHLTQQEVKVLGLNSFRETKLNFHRAYLNCDWGMTSIAFVGASVPLCADIPVNKMMVRLYLNLN